MFGTVLTIVVACMQVYVFWRSATVPFVRRFVPLKVLIGAGVLLWTGFVSGRMLGHAGTGVFAGMIELLGMDWLGIVFLFFVPLFMADIVTGFGFAVPSLAPSLRGFALLAGGLFSMIALVQGMRPPVVLNYEVQLPGLPAEMEGKVIIAMSDLHLGSLLGARWLEARVAQVQAQHPDIIVLLGDIGEGHGQLQGELPPVLRRLSAPLGVWAVLGNHEFHGTSSRNISLLKESGFMILQNRWAEVRPGFILAGVNDLTSGRRSGQDDSFIAQAVAGMPRGAAILLSHTPWQAEKAASAGVELMLCGHTHGGQLWPFSYLVRKRYPLFEGRYEVNGMTVIVCRGTGTWGPRMRLWHPGEMLRITLHAKA